MRSKLFVPGSRPELFAKALASQADAISFDLEDAVAPEAKDDARQHLAGFFAALPATAKTLVVRINDLSSRHYRADLEALIGTRVDIINLPKVEAPGQVLQLLQDIEALESQRNLPSRIRILATIESPKGLRRAAEIASAHPRLMGLQLGFADLLEPLGISRQDVGAVQHIQLSVRLAAGEAGVAVYDSSFAAVNDPEGYRSEATHARRLGFSGKSCIHPTQIDMANQAFLPNQDEIAQAQRVMAAAGSASNEGVGAYLVDGKMVDKPFVERAAAILAQARVAGLLAG